MFKRLIIAVLALGFTLGLSGTAFSSDVDRSIQPGNAYSPANPSHARTTQLKKAKNVTMPSGRINGTNVIQELPNGTSSQAHAPAIGCSFTGHHNGAPAFFWELPTDLGGVLLELPTVRFTAPAGEQCTVKTGSVLVYGSELEGDAGMRVYLYDDDGFGFPGAKLDSVDFPNGSLPASGLYWADADFSPAGWVFEDGEEYHIGFTVLSNSPDDTLAYITDDATGHAPAAEPRNHWYLDGTGFDFWIATQDVFSSPDDVDWGFFVEAETCCAEIPFSDCYSQSWNSGVAYIWPTPDALYADSAYAMRFDVGGPETLASVDFAVYNATASGTTRKGSAYVFGDDAIHVTVYDDDGFGLPGTMLAQVTVPGSSYSAYPAVTNAPFPPLVLTSTFHIALSSSGTVGLDCEVFLSDNGGSATGRGSDNTPGFGWDDMLTVWGVDAAFLITANLCRDEFSDCSITTPFTGFSHVYAVPETVNGNTMWGQKFTGVGANCQVRNVQLTFAWASSDGGRAATMYTDNTDISVYTDVAGLPGAPIATITLTPADYASFGNVGFTGSTYLFTGTIDFTPLSVELSGDYWLVVAPQTAVRDSGIRVALALTAGGAGYVGSGATFSNVFGNQWYVIDDFFGGVLADAAVSFVSEHCCVPFAERACSGTSDWPRAFGNNASDGTSQVSLSDSWCDLNRLWSYSETNASAATVSGIGPIIYEGKVVANFFDRYRRFDLATGTLEYTWGPAGAGIGGGFALGTQLTGSGAIYTVGGSEILYLGGGGNNNIVAVDWNAPATTIWGIATGPNNGPIRGGAFLVLNQAGTDVLYYVTNSGNVVARDAATGVLYPGWATNPVSLGGNSSEVTGATDGTNLYFSTAPSAANGSVFKIDAATGAILWSLPAVDLKGSTVWPAASVTREIFNAGVSTDGASVYAVSAVPTGFGNHPSEGVYYKLNASTGAVEGFSATESAIRQAPIVDQNRVMVLSNSRWGGGTLGLTTVIAMSKQFSTIDWTAEHPDPLGQRARAGVLTCEPLGVSDKLYVVADAGWMFVYDADNGDEIYQRRWEDLVGGGTNSAPRGIAAGNGPYVAVTTRNQYLVSMTKGVDRPRLEFQSFAYTQAVNFGSNPALPLNLGPNIVNTGCATLDIGTVLADENPFPNVRIPAFSIADNGASQGMTRSGDIADLLTKSTFALKGGVKLAANENADEFAITTGIERDNRNRAASAVPPWLVSITHPASTDLIAAGDTADLEIVIDQNLINRGPNVVYVQVASNDPDYFLNDPAGIPQFEITLVGGCLPDTTHLEFGIGAANLELVWNQGRLGDGDLTPHGFGIDGDDAAYFQGSYVYAVAADRYAIGAPDWQSLDDEWISLQGDPNWCDSTCKPFLTSPYNVGAISSNGITYTPIDASMICRSYLDSVQNFGGNYELYSAAPFDNDSTMGLFVRSRVVGAVDEPSLANVTVDLMTVTERNGDSVPNWFFGSMNDYDLGGGDTIGLDQSVSTAFAWRKTGAAQVWGQIKLPFGCGETPVRNVRGTDGDVDGYWEPNIFIPNLYTYLSAASGTVGTGATLNSRDFQMTISHLGKSFGPNETIEFGVAHFGYPTLASTGATTTSAPATIKTLARQVNKWVGYGRGDVNNDNLINLADIVYLAANVHFAGPGPIPFAHLGDVDASGGAANAADVTYLINYYFNCGPCPMGEFVF